jgi:hypothetical protein
MELETALAVVISGSFWRSQVPLYRRNSRLMGIQTLLAL